MPDIVYKNPKLFEVTNALKHNQALRQIVSLLAKAGCLHMLTLLNIVGNDTSIEAAFFLESVGMATESNLKTLFDGGSSLVFFFKVLNSYGILFACNAQVSLNNSKEFWQDIFLLNNQCFSESEYKRA